LKKRGITWTALVCIVLLLVYAASPYFSFWRFTVALRSNDSAALDARVDFPAVRESLETQLIRWFSPANSEMRIKNKRLARLSRSVTPKFINALVDVYVTPDGFRALLSDPKAVREIRSPQQLHIGRPAD
jgi:hypothetical protein